MVTTNQAIRAPFEDQDFGHPGNLRPGTTVTWSNGTGPFDIEVQWDTVTSFDSGSLITVTENGVTSPKTKFPTSDLGPVGTSWYTRARIRDSSATWSSYAGPVQMHWVDARLQNRFLHLMTNVGVGFTPKDDAAGWGTGIGGTQGPDGDNRLLNRYQHLHINLGVAFSPKDSGAGWGTGIGGTEGSDGFNVLLNRYFHLMAKVGVGFRFVDQPPPNENDGWGLDEGGTWGDGDERMFHRFLHLQEALTTDVPTPYIFHLNPNFGRVGEAFLIVGWGFRPYFPWSQGVVPTLSGGGAAVAADFTNGHLPVQTGEDKPGVAWFDFGTLDPVFTIDLTSPREINEVSVWYKLTDPFASVTIEWADSGGGPWTPVVTAGTPASMDPDGDGFAVAENWSTGSNFGTHRFWRFTFVDAQSVGEIQVNRRMAVPTGDIDPRMDDGVADWLLSVSSQSYSQLAVQVPATDQLGGDVRVVNEWPVPDLTSNEKFFTIFAPAPSELTGVLIKMYDRDAPQQLIAIVADALNIQFHDILSGIGSAEFSLPNASDTWEVTDFMQKYNVVRVFVDQIMRWWGFVVHTTDVVVGEGENSAEIKRFVCKEGVSFLTRFPLYPVNWPSLTGDRNWVFTNATAGKILVDIIAQAQTLGYFVGMTLTFDALEDSHGEAWVDTFTMTFQPGTLFSEVIGQLVSLGIDIDLNDQFEFHAYNLLGFHLETRDDGPVLMPGDTITKLELTEDFQDPGNVALIAYGEDAYLAYEDPVKILEWGRFGMFGQSSAGDATSAQRTAEAAVELAGTPIDQIAIEIRRDRGVLEPYVHFNLGDWITVRSPIHNIDAVYRVRAFTLTAEDVFEPAYVVDLNSIKIEKIIEHEIKLKKATQNTLPIDVAQNEPGGSSPREHDHSFPPSGDLGGSVDAPTVTGWSGTPINPGPFVEGDMWYYNLDLDQWELVEGTLAPGRRPTIQPDGTVAWQGGGYRNLAIGRSYTLSPAPGVGDGAFFRLLPGDSNWTQVGFLTDGFTGSPPDVASWWNEGMVGWTDQASIVVRLDLGSAQSGYRVRLWGANDNSNNVYLPATVSLEWSDNDSSWTLVETKGSLTQTDSDDGNWVCEFDISTQAAHRYWRVTVTDAVAGTSIIYLSELEFWALA